MSFQGCSPGLPAWCWPREPLRRCHRPASATNSTRSPLVVIGGTSLAGGRGSLVGTLFGALIIGTINNGMDLMGVSSYYQQLLKGAIIVAAVIADRFRK